MSSPLLPTQPRWDRRPAMHQEGPSVIMWHSQVKTATSECGHMASPSRKGPGQREKQKSTIHSLAFKLLDFMFS